MCAKLHEPNSWEGRDLRSHLHGFSDVNSLKTEGPTILSSGDGVYVEDVNGKRYLEGNAGLWNAVLGFNHKGVQDAACEQIHKFGAYHTFFGRASEPTVALAEKMVEIAPGDMTKAYFTNSGSEANDSAVKMLWFINHETGKPQRRKIISRRGAYHGVTGLAASMTARDYNQVFGLPLADFIATDTPHYWRFAEPGETELEFSQRLANNLDELIQKEDPSTIAGFVAEPVMGAGGVVPPPEGYFEAIQVVLDRYDIPLVADEVITALGRSGELWGTQTYNMKPDIIIASKCVTAGYAPIGVVLVSSKIEAQLMEAAAGCGEFPNGFTNAGHPVSCAIGLRTVQALLEEGVFENMRKVSGHFDRHMQKYADHPNIGEVRSVGLMGALEVVKDIDTKTPFDPSEGIGDKIASRALDHGLICRPIGASIVLAPPFIITEPELDELFEKLGKTIDEILPA